MVEGLKGTTKKPQRKNVLEAWNRAERNKKTHRQRLEGHPGNVLITKLQLT